MGLVPDLAHHWEIGSVTTWDPQLAFDSVTGWALSWDPDSARSLAMGLEPANLWDSGSVPRSVPSLLPA